MFNIISYKNFYLTFSGILVAASIFSLVIFGLKFGIDFAGGTLWEIEFINNRPNSADIEKALAEFQPGNLTIQPTGEKGAILKFRSINENTHQAAFANLNILSPAQEKRFESIGPIIGTELKKNAIKAIVLVLLLIIAYIAWAFRKVSRPVASWKYGVIAIIALLHDVTIPTGVFALLGHFYGIEVDTLFVTALLTILGFSVHDTIVVFDRIRENLKRRPQESFTQTINASINETISRSINTSLTVLLVLVATFFLGGESIKYFSLALIIGVFFGTYSSIFVAGPLLSYWAKKK